MKCRFSKLSMIASPAILFCLSSAGYSAMTERLATPEEQQTIVGLYAHYDVVSYVGKLPIGTMKTQVITYGLTEFRWENGQLIESDEFCHAEHRSNLPMRSIVDDSLTQAIVPLPTAVEVRVGSHGRLLVFRPETPTLLGIYMDPEEALPENPKDPRIVDADQDGKPGVTVKLKLFGAFPAEIYLARRERFAYELERAPDGTLTGLVHDASEQLVLGASHHFLTAQNNPHQDPDLSRSPIHLTPVAADANCESLKPTFSFRH